MLNCTCIECKVKFHRKPSYLKSYPARFCSIKCRSGWMSKNTSGNKSWNYTRVKAVCKNCGSIFDAKPSKVDKGEAKFCSNKCYHKFTRDNSKRTLARIIRGCPRMKLWRQEVFKRDKFKCTICGKVGGILEAHHRVKFSVLFKEAQENLPLLEGFDSCMQYDPLWDYNNGITVCLKCHKQLHK